MSTSHRDKTVDTPDVICGTCQTTNSGERRFCGRCGQRLWQPCNDCQAPNATDLKYCGNCGIALQQAFERRVNDIKARLKRFETLRRDARYLEARATLQTVEDTGDTRLQALFAEIQGKLENLSDERTQRSAEAARQFLAAQQALNTSDFSGALHILRQIPPGLRDRPMSDALEIASAAVEEIQTLAERIKKALSSQMLDGLSPHVHRLLELRPGDEKLIKLAGQLEQRQQQQHHQTTTQRLALAQQLLQQGQYAQAARALEAVAEEHVTPEHRKLFNLVIELDELVRCLTLEPYLHPSLLGVAERWQKLRPRDADAARIADQVRKRLATPAKVATFARPWTKLPETTRLGCPIQWWRGLQHVPISTDVAAYHQAPSRFLVAYGLALQGLGAARVQLSLLPRRNTALIQKLSGLRKSPPNTVWGCDLGGSGLKALQLRREKASGALEVCDAVSVPHAASLAEAPDDQAVAQTLRETMARFLEEHVVDQPSVVVGFSAPRSLGRTFEIPNFKSKKREEAIAYEAKMQIPIPADEITYDWHAWPIADKSLSFQQVTLLAARRDHVNQLVEACAGLPIKIAAIQSVYLALYNTAIAEFFVPLETTTEGAAPTPQPLGILDVGADSSSLIIAAPNMVRHRSLPIGTSRLDHALMSKFNLTRAQAQQLRHQPTSARWMNQVSEALTPVIDELARDLQRTLRAYETEGIHVDRLLVSGGGSEQLGLVRQLIHGN